MSWSEMKGDATVASLEHAKSAVRRTQAPSWDPFEVWLTRIKQPRDRSSKSAPVATSSGIGDRRD